MLYPLVNGFLVLLSEAQHLQVIGKACSMELICHSTLNRVGKRFLLFQLQSMQVCFVLE